MHHEDPQRPLPAPCHTAQAPDGTAFFVPGCAGRANEPDNLDNCTCVDFKDAALAEITRLREEVKKLSWLYHGVVDDYRKAAAQLRALGVEV
ncbi:hypothetical protein ACGF12_13790 [Kitasatospora sp. NPDC048296]|uniref:hypothetical protein n=1 Tax=Kitasatospora sp. NPDC048296 TaxID=3364048 RepID=UPI00371ACE03